MESLFKVMDGDQWVLNITTDGKIEFNTDAYPDLAEDGFSKKFVEYINSEVVFDGLDYKQLQQAYAHFKNRSQELEDVAYGLRARISDMTKSK